MPTESTWKLNGLKRWIITADLQTESPLHVGSTETTEHPKIKDEHGKPVQINAMIRGQDNLPIIPGSTIKGIICQWLEERDAPRALLDTIFGKGHNSQSGDQGRGGRAEFHDARIEKENQLTGSQPYPYWRQDLQTCIIASTAIDRHLNTALHQSLHYTEAVPPGVRFTFKTTGFMTDAEADLLLAALEIFCNQEQACRFGAGTANGWGHMSLYGNPDVRYLDKGGIVTWLNNQPDQMAMTADSVSRLSSEDLRQRTERIISSWPTAAPENRLEITINFDGPFLVNDPDKDDLDNTDVPDKSPLVDRDGNPVLPASSFRGALRSQAEKIIRTLGGHCCDTALPCEAVYSQEEVENLCLACRVFGAAGWKTTLLIDDFVCDTVLNKSRKQTFVAIDRFHGGGKEGALFTVEHAESPVFSGTLSISDRMPEWGKGLLALVLRDLREGDITFGYGAAKGYGRPATASVPALEQLVPFVEQFREKCQDRQGTYECCSAPQPETLRQDSPNSLQVDEPSTDEHTFLNPYNFVPIKEPVVSHWLGKKRLDETCSHSHAFYRRETDAGEPLYHGRLTCLLKTETPLFIGADKDDTSLPFRVKNYRLNGEIAVPAASLRGMLSSLVEAASNSAMRVLHDGTLSYRQEASDAQGINIGMLVVNGDQQHAVAHLSEFQRVIRLKNAYTDPDMQNFLADKNSWSPQHNRVYYLPPNRQGIPQEEKKPGMIPGFLRILGKDTGRWDDLQNKKHEYFIEIPNQYVDSGNRFDYQTFIGDVRLKRDLLPITPLAWERYHALAEERTLSQKSDRDLKADESCDSSKWLPFHLKGGKRVRDAKRKVCFLPLRQGDLVFYQQERHRQHVTRISLSAIWRDRVEDSRTNTAATVNCFVPPELVPFNENRQYISPAELLFGFVELNKDREKEEKRKRHLAYAGKVGLSAALPLHDLPDEEMLDEGITLKALSSPKPPSPALYFSSGSDTYINKKDLSAVRPQINGRKYYLHALREQDDPEQVQGLGGNGYPSAGAKPPWETQHPEIRPEMKVRIQPIKPKKSFYFHVDFNNLAAWEIGLLCFALRPDEHFRHRLGMGKPIGMGTIKIDIVGLRTIDRRKRYAEDSLEGERFNQHCWKAAGFNEVPVDYLSEMTKQQGQGPDDYTRLFLKTIDEDIYRALELLGNPDHVHYPVHYPQVRNHDIEDKNFQWFVANDKGTNNGRKKDSRKEISARNHYLKSLKQNPDHLPVLERHEWLGE